MATSDTITYSSENEDKPILMVPESIAESVARHLTSAGISCALPGEDEIDTAEPLSILPVEPYSEKLQTALEQWLTQNGFEFKRERDESEAKPKLVTWRYSNR